MDEVQPPQADVGVIVARFQVHELHKAHRDLIDHVRGKHDRVLILLGLSPCRVTYNNPLDFAARKQMLQEAYPEIGVYYIKDSISDDLWSRRLDSMIQDQAKPGASIMLYGGRDSFVKHYDGKYPTTEMRQDSFVSGKAVRKTISNQTMASADFRAGVIWASQNQWPKAIPTIDVAIWDDEMDSVLLARKEDEILFRFVGGFATGPTYEADARREVDEETTLSITDPQYVGSHQVDDWRYRSEVDKIVTLLFQAKKLSGKERPQDDIVELKWFQFDSLTESAIVPTHRPLLKMLQCKREASDARDAK